MRQGPHQKRGRGRGNRRPNTPNRNQTFDSNGPDVRIRGNAHQVFEKYLNLARDASAGGDRVLAESYFQHAEHYYRIVSAIAESDAERRERQAGNGAQPEVQSRDWSGEDGERPAEREGPSARQVQDPAIEGERAERPGNGGDRDDGRPPRRPRRPRYETATPDGSGNGEGEAAARPVEAAASEPVAADADGMRRTLKVPDDAAADADAQGDAPAPRRRRRPSNPDAGTEPPAPNDDEATATG